MTRLHIGVEQKLVLVGFQFAQFCHPLHRLEILYLRVVKSGGHKNTRVVLRFYLVVRRVGKHVVIAILVVGITPLVVLVHGQRNGFIQHGCDHIHERNFGGNAAVKIRFHVYHGTHQQAPRAATGSENLVGRGVFLFDQSLGYIDKVSKGVLFIEHLSVFIPGPPQFLTTANMGNGEHEAPVQK